MNLANVLDIVAWRERLIFLLRLQKVLSQLLLKFNCRDAVFQHKDCLLYKLFHHDCVYFITLVWLWGCIQVHN